MDMKVENRSRGQDLNPHERQGGVVSTALKQPLQGHQSLL